MARSSSIPCIRTAAGLMAPSGKTAKARILVLQTPDAPELKVLEQLPDGAHIVGIGRNLHNLAGPPLCIHFLPNI